MSPAVTSNSLTIGTDFSFGYRFLDVNRQAIELAQWDFSATLKSANGTLLAVPIIQICDPTTNRITLSHTITSTLTAQAAQLRLWGTRIEDGLISQFLVARITISP